LKLAVFGVQIAVVLIDFQLQIARIKRILRFAGFEFAGKIG
jgi:hypothetical protein